MTDAEIYANLTPHQRNIWNGKTSHEPSVRAAYMARWRGEPAKRIVRSSGPSDCAHFGEQVGDVACPSCGGGESRVRVKTFACAVHGECTPAKRVEGKACCRKCKDYQPKDAIPLPMVDAVQPNAVFTPDSPYGSRPAGWPNRPEVIAEHQRAADAFLAALPTYPENHYSGRGIVIAAGGKYWASAYVTVRMLRYVGCTLPVECWYLGASGERDERYERLLAPFNVTFHDIDTHPARASRRVVKGFGTKLFAVVNSAFEEALSLDPDCYPCQDPTILFECPSYKRLGGIYWPDRDFTEQWTKWDVWGCPRRGPCGLETGMYVIHKRLAWEPLKLAEWYDDRPEMYYGTPVDQHISVGADYGDKGPHRAAWAKLRRDYAVFNPVPHHRGIAYLQPGPDGATPMFVHRCHSKFTVEGPLRFPTTPQNGENVRGGLPGEDAAFGFLDELKSALALPSGYAPRAHP